MVILLELLEKLRHRVNEVHIDGSETILLCYTITEHRAQNAVRDAHAQKRDCERESTEVDTAALPHRRECDRPDKIAEYNDLVSVISERLDPRHARVVELMVSGTLFKDIADELGITTRVLDGMRKSIKETARRVTEEKIALHFSANHQPSTIRRKRTT